MGTTPKLALRYPELTDRVADGATNIRNLAEDVEAMIAPYVCRLRAVAVQTLATGVAPIALLMDTEDEDPQGFHPAGSSASATVPAGGAGIYMVSASLTLTANATGNRQVMVLKNGTPIPGTALTIPGQAANTNVIPSGCVPVRLAVGDVIQAAAWQTSGGNLNTIAGSTLTLARVSP